MGWISGYIFYFILFYFIFKSFFFPWRVKLFGNLLLPYSGKPKKKKKPAGYGYLSFKKVQTQKTYIGIYYALQIWYGK
jgi:hypothetical protein